MNRERLFFPDRHETNSLHFLFCYVCNPTIGTNVYCFAGWCFEMTNDSLVQLVAEAPAEQCTNDKCRENFHLLPNAPGQPRRTADTEVEKDIVEALGCDRWFGFRLLWLPSLE